MHDKNVQLHQYFLVPLLIVDGSWACPGKFYKGGPWGSLVLCSCLAGFTAALCGWRGEGIYGFLVYFFWYLHLVFSVLCSTPCWLPCAPLVLLVLLLLLLPLLLHLLLLAPLD